MQIKLNASMDKTESLDAIREKAVDKGVEASKPKRKPKRMKATLADLDSMAVDTGIADLADQHEHYLYGTPKR